MNRTVLALCLFFSYSLLAQTVEELEYDISVYHGGETYKDKIKKARQLLSLDPFNELATRLTLDYYVEEKIDSIPKYFDNLISNHPKNPAPYILRAKLLFYEKDYRNNPDYTTWKISYLSKAIELDSLNLESLYYLSKAYYEDFIYPYEKKDSTFLFLDSNKQDDELKISTFEHSADSTLKYFYRLWDIDVGQRDVIFFPIKQVECFLGRVEKSPIQNSMELINENCYFPAWYFANLPENWECDFTKNYFSDVEFSKYGSEGLKVQLIDLKEPCLYKSKIEKNQEIYRFTWLRSFDNPISLRIEKSEQKVELFWKVGKGAGGYKPRGLKRKGRKKLKISHWEEFIVFLKDCDFQNLPNNKYVPMNDGADWTLEYRSNSSFKAHNTNWPSEKFKESCLYLLNHSRIKIKPKDIY